MNYDELINSIVEEIYKKINGKSDLNINRKKAIVVWDNNLENYSKIQSEYEVISYEEGLTEYDAVIISSLCLRGLSNLAQGSSISGEERFILKAIMLGKKVYIMENGMEYRKYKDTAPEELYKKFISFERELISYGIKVIEDVSILLDYKDSSIEVKREVVSNNTDEKVIEFRNKRLISEGDLKKPHINGVKKIIVDKKTKITPLAADYIRIHHLKVERN
ncbi:MAG: ethanolamine utilization protein [Clostridium sp.]